MADQTAWILIEFIGGPRDRDLVQLPTATIGPLGGGLDPSPNATGCYLPTSTWGASDLEFDVWALAERSAIARFGGGSPDVYLRLVWNDAAGPLRPPVGLLDTLLAGSGDAARAIALSLSKRGADTVEMVDSHLAPALRTIGRRWQTGELSVLHEHRASSIARRILTGDEARATATRGRAITAVLTGDPHSIPSEMAAQALRDDAWHVDHLGAMTPPQELINGLQPTDTDLVVLSPTMPANRALSLATASRLRDRGLTVLVGSPGTRLAELRRQAASVRDRIGHTRPDQRSAHG